MYPGLQILSSDRIISFYNVNSAVGSYSFMLVSYFILFCMIMLIFLYNEVFNKSQKFNMV